MWHKNGARVCVAVWCEDTINTKMLEVLPTDGTELDVYRESNPRDTSAVAVIELSRLA